MKVERLDHVHVYVSDLKEVAKFLSDLMGTKWVGPMEFPEDGVITAFDNLGIELIQPTSPDNPVGKIVKKQGNIIASIGFKVPSVDEAVADLESRGIRILWKGGNESLKGAVADRRDTKGIMLELLEYEERTPISLANINMEKLIDIPSPI